MSYYNITRILTTKREILGLSRNQICNLCGNQITEKTLYRVEKGQTGVSEYMLEELDYVYSNKKARIFQFCDKRVRRIYSDGIRLIKEGSFSEAISALSIVKESAENEEKKMFISELLELVKSLKDGEEIPLTQIESLESFFLTTMAIDLQKGKWPLFDFEIDFFLLLINLYKNKRMYEKQEKLARFIIDSISIEYMEAREFADVSIVAESALIDALQDNGKHIEAIKQVISVLPILYENGEVIYSNKIIYSLIWSLEKMDFFNDKILLSECVSELKRLGILSKVLGNEKSASFYLNKYEKLINQQSCKYGVFSSEAI